MGDISVMARRLKDGHVQYGWSGNGGYCKNTGFRLLAWYDDPEMIEYLFSLGQMALIGKPGSEHGGESMMLTHEPDGMPHWLGTSERDIFSRIAFVDYGYFYDLDNTWYYIIPGPMRIKIPLHYIANHLNEDNFEFDELDKIQHELALRMIEEPKVKNIIKKYKVTPEEIRDEIIQSQHPIYDIIFNKYRNIYNYFDD